MGKTQNRSSKGSNSSRSSKKSKKRVKRRSRFKNIFMLVLLIISGTAGFFAAKAQVAFNYTLNHVERDYNSKLSTVDLSGIKVKSDDDIVNILFTGNDAREEKYYTNEQGLRDVIMIATMDKKHGILKLTSLMRDTWVYIPAAEKYGRINSATNYEGKYKSLYKTIAQNFNIKLEGFVEVDFNAFKKVIDALGGVEVELTDTEVRYLSQTNYIQKKKFRKGLVVGKQTLNGEQALGYCRIRKGKDIIGEPVVTVSGLTDDYGRTWRQRAVISSAFEKLKTMPISSWYDIANKVLEDVVTDLDNEQIIGYMKDVALMGTMEIHQLQIPQEPYFYWDSSTGLVLTDGISSESNTAKNAEIMQKFIFDYDGEGDFEADGDDNSESTND